MRLETEKLILREFTLDDLDAFAWLMADPEVMRFSLSGPMNRELASEYLQKRILDHYVKYGYGLYAVVQKADHCLIGFVGLIGQNIDGESKVELGYRLHPKYWGKGLATEACLAVCQYAFTQLGMDELISIIDPKNTRSFEVAKRVGMKYLKEASFHHIPVQIYMIKAPESSQKLVIRNLQVEDLDKLANTFTFPWSSFEATLKLWEQWFKEHQEGIRTVCVLERHNQFLGYGSLLRVSEYPFFREKGIPEVNAIWIDEPFRKQGLGKKLIEHLESMARHEGYKTIGIGVGLYKDYGPAQRLYYKMGYQPDGNGVSYKGQWVVPGALHPIDDDLLIWFTKSLVMSKPSFHFRHVDATERSLIHHWLLQPHVAQWFYGQGLENTFKHLDEFLAGSSFAEYWLAFDKGHPFAFLITSHVDKPHDELAKWCNSDGQAMTLDMLIGDPSYLGKGYAVRVIHQFLLSQFSNVNEVLIDPEATNAKAIHVYQKAGFNKLDEFIPSHSPHPHYMMKLNLQELRKQQGKLGDSKF